jgi:hypothetical protein
MVGLRKTGGLVVFESKLAKDIMAFGVFAALMQSLDYLTCLSCDPNLKRIKKGFEIWKKQKRLQHRIPNGFEDVEPKCVKPMSVVLAPEEYFGNYDLRHDKKWRLFASHAIDNSQSVDIRFVSCDVFTLDTSIMV